MRDERGRYHATKPIADFMPEWAKGCPHCTFGIVSAPELTRACELYLERLVQAIDGDIHFCTCPAGERYRVSLLNRRRILLESGKSDSRMATYPDKRSHPDIDLARWAMSQSAGQTHSVPTIHYEPAPPPATPTPAREGVSA